MALGSPARLLSEVSERLRLPGPKQARIRRPCPAPARRAADGDPGLADLVRRARRRGIPLTLAESPADYPWRSEFLLVRPDQHIAWRAEDPAGIDIETAAGLHPERDPVRAGI